MFELECATNRPAQSAHARTRKRCANFGVFASSVRGATHRPSAPAKLAEADGDDDALCAASARASRCAPSDTSKVFLSFAPRLEEAFRPRAVRMAMLTNRPGFIAICEERLAEPIRSRRDESCVVRVLRC